MYFQAIEIQNWMDKAGTFSKQQSFYLVRGRTKEKTQMEDTTRFAKVCAKTILSKAHRVQGQVCATW